jgi:ABC-type iron transport system FetAB ATPase subunit
MINNIKITITAIIIAVIAILSYFAYSAVYNRGMEQAKLECQQEKQKYELQVKQKIQDLETALQQTAIESERKKQELGKTIKDIKSKLSAQPITVIENGKCIPAVIFLDSINQAISKANQQ